MFVRDPVTLEKFLDVGDKTASTTSLTLTVAAIAIAVAIVWRRLKYKEKAVLIGALLVLILIGMSVLLKVPNGQLVLWWCVEILVLALAGILSLITAKNARTAEQIKRKAEVLSAALDKDIAPNGDAIEAAVNELKRLKIRADGLPAACENAKAEVLSSVLDKNVKSTRVDGVTRALKTTVQNHVKIKRERRTAQSRVRELEAALTAFDGDLHLGTDLVKVASAIKTERDAAQRQVATLTNNVASEQRNIEVIKEEHSTALDVLERRVGELENREFDREEQDMKRQLWEEP